MRSLVLTIVVVTLVTNATVFGSKVDPSGGWDVLWEFSSDASLPATLAYGASISLTGNPALAEISDGSYRFGENSAYPADSAFNWPGMYFNADAPWTFDIKFRLTGPNRERYNFYGYVRIPGQSKDMVWNWDVGADLQNPDGLYLSQHDAGWSTKIFDEYDDWHVLRVTHHYDAAKVILYLDDANEPFRNNSYGAMVDYGYDGFGIGGGTDAFPKNWEIDYIRYADEPVFGAPGPPIAEVATNCEEVYELGNGIDGDFNEDCYISLPDFAGFVDSWLQCNNPADPNNCEKPWE